MNASIRKVNSDLQAVCDWAVRNKLELNADKSKAIAIGAKGSITVPPVRIHGVEISYSMSVKNLGMIMNSLSTWSNHVAKIQQRIFIGLRSLWPLSKSTPMKTRRILAKALLLPHVDYCSVVYYYGLDSESWKVLNASVNSIVRYAYGLGRYDSTDGYVTRFLGCSLDMFLKVRAMSFLYKLDCSGQPAYLRDLLLRGQSIRSMQLVIPRSELAIGRKTLFVQGLLDWNSIPTRIRMCSSINVFQRQCVEFFNQRSSATIYD